MTSYRHTSEGYDDVFAAPRETTDAERERTNRLLAEARPIVSALDAANAAWEAAWDGGERRPEVLDPLEAAYNHAFQTYATWMRTTCNTLKKTESPNNARAIVDYLVSRARILNQPDQPTDNHGEPIDPTPGTRGICPKCQQRNGYSTSVLCGDCLRNLARDHAPAPVDIPCAFCGKPSGAGAQICPTCMNAAVDSDPGEANEPAHTCYYCDTPIAAGRKYCNDCGQREPGLPCATCGHIISIREPYYVDNGVHHIGCYPR